jgi:hypothetical protein
VNIIIRIKDYVRDRYRADVDGLNVQLSIIGVISCPTWSLERWQAHKCVALRFTSSCVLHHQRPGDIKAHQICAALLSSQRQGRA